MIRINHNNNNAILQNFGSNPPKSKHTCPITQQEPKITKTHKKNAPDFEKIKQRKNELLKLKVNGEQRFEPEEAQLLAELNEKDFKRSVKISKTKFEKLPKSEEIYVSVKDLPDKLWNRLEKIVTESEEPKFSLNVAYFLAASFDDKSFEKLQERNLLKNIQGRDNQFSEFFELKSLTEIEDADWERIKDHEILKTANAQTVACFAELSRFDFENKKSHDDFTQEEIKQLIPIFCKNNAILFDKNIQKHIDSPIFPKNSEDYCRILPQLINTVNTNYKKVNTRQLNLALKSLDNLTKKESGFLDLDLNAPNFKVRLAYPRKNFVADVSRILAKSPDNEKLKITNCFNFNLPQKNGEIIMFGYPTLENSELKIENLPNTKMKNTAKKIAQCIEKFNNNKITVAESPALEKALNDFTKVFPEFNTAIGKQQHKTHDSSVDVHTLKVLQHVMRAPEYKNLNKEDKIVANISALFHDIAKEENLLDKAHPINSAYDAANILEKTNLPKRTVSRIVNHVKNHDWLERCNRAPLPEDIPYNKTIDKNLQRAQYHQFKAAYNFRYGNDFEIAKMICAADLKSIQKDECFYNHFKNDLKEHSKQINKYLYFCKSTSINLPQEKIPKASELKNDGKQVYEINKDGIKNKVLQLNHDMDLGQYGFAKGLNSNDFNVLAHAVENDNSVVTFQNLNRIDNSAILSSSYINYSNKDYKPINNEGLLINVDSKDIHVAYFHDIDSGYLKNFDNVFKNILYNSYDETNGVRNFVSNVLKDELDLSDEEYISIFECDKIINKPMSELKKDYPALDDAYKNLFDKMKSLRTKQNNICEEYNEVLVSNPTIKAVFAFDKKADEILPTLRKYAQDNDLPIILFN